LDGFAWEVFPQFQAISYFANGIGAAKYGDIENAQLAYETLDSLYNSIKKAPQNICWKNQIDIQKPAVQAWITYASGDIDQGMKIMNDAASMEDLTTKSLITPGALLPIREMLGNSESSRGRELSNP